MTGHTLELGRLDLNESPFPPSSAIVTAIAEAARGLNRYPDQEEHLMSALGDYAGVAADRIVLSSGSNELLHMLPLLSGAIRDDDHVVIAAPSFPTYEKVSGFHGLAVSKVPLTAGGTADVDAMLDCIGPKTRLVCVPSPNNPTGGMLDESALEALVSGMPPDVMLHMDEAYYEFGRYSGGPDCLPFLSRMHGSWLSTRSFSKAFGLAGLRLGYGIACSAEMAARWRSMRPNFNVNSLAIAGGIAALREAGAARRAIAEISAQRDWLADKLGALGLRPMPSAGNFLAVPALRLGTNPQVRLKHAGLTVSRFELECMPFLRITIGSHTEVKAVLEALSAMVE